MYDQFLNCLIRATSVAKKIVALQSKDAMIKFLYYANYYPKTPQLFWLAMNEKNNQVRHFVMLYLKTMLHAHAPKEQVRHSMDRSGGTDLIGKILDKALTDATPIVRETCREPFWAFWYFWHDRGEALLRTLSPAILKPLEKSKSSALALLTDPTAHCPPHSTQQHSVSPSSSNTSAGSHDSSTKSKLATSNNGPTGLHKRSMSPSLLRSTSPLVFRHHASTQQTPSATQGHTINQGLLSATTAATTTSTASNLRKSRVPGLTRKKSMLSVKRKQSILAMLQQDDMAVRVEGLQALSRKLSPYNNYPVDIATIQVDAGGGTNALTVDGATFQSVILTLFTSANLEQNPKLYEALSTWDSVLGVMVKLIPFDDYVPKLMLDCAIELPPPQQQQLQLQKKDDEWTKFTSASRSWARTKWCLKRQDSMLADKIFQGLASLDGTTPTTASHLMKKKPALRPMDRRKLTKQWLIWMDELVCTVIGLDNSNDDDDPWLEETGEDPGLLRHGLGRAYWQDIFANHDDVASAWFESDSNVRQCLHLLLPMLLTSAPGSLWHDPLVTLVGHLRLINQKLFDMLAGTLDDAASTKISRILGIHLRPVFPPPPTFPPQTQIATTMDPPYSQNPDVNNEEEQQAILDEEPPQVNDANEQEPQMDNANGQEPQMDNANGQESQVDVAGEHEHQVNYANGEEHHGNHSNEQEPQVDDATEQVPQIDDANEQEPQLDDANEQEPQANHANELEPHVDQVYEPEPHVYLEQEPQVDYEEGQKLQMDHTNGLVHQVNLPNEENTIESTTLPTTSTDDIPGPQDEPTTSIHSSSSPSSPCTSPPFATVHPTEQTEDSDPSMEPACIPSPIPTLSPTTAHSIHQETKQNHSQFTPSSDTPLIPAPTSTASLVSERQNSQPNSIPAARPHIPYYSPNPQQQQAPTPWLEVFEANQRSDGTRDKAAPLYQMIDKLQHYGQQSLGGGVSATHQQHGTVFRKLMRISKESPIQKKWDQGGLNEQPGCEVWASAKNDGGNYVELMQVILQHLAAAEPGLACCSLALLDLVRQLAMAQTGLMRFYEMKLDRHGMTLESRLLEQLLIKRGNLDPTICTAAEDAMEAVLIGLEPQTVFDVFLAYLTYRLTMSDNSMAAAEEVDNKPRYDPVASAFMFLGQSAGQVNNTLFIEEWLIRGGVAMFIKGVNHELIQVRKACVHAMVAFQEILGDEFYLFFGSNLRQDQLDLIRHYVHKSIKKKASLRQLCANGHLK
ncbi:unnamed protein product [Absidia cylindrospora]